MRRENSWALAIWGSATGRNAGRCSSWHVRHIVYKQRREQKAMQASDFCSANCADFRLWNARHWRWTMRERINELFQWRRRLPNSATSNLLVWLSSPIWSSIFFSKRKDTPPGLVSLITIWSSVGFQASSFILHLREDLAEIGSNKGNALTLGDFDCPGIPSNYLQEGSGYLNSMMMLVVSLWKPSIVLSPKQWHLIRDPSHGPATGSL